MSFQADRVPIPVEQYTRTNSHTQKAQDLQSLLLPENGARPRHANELIMHE
jgi:hypothetical protein